MESQYTNPVQHQAPPQDTLVAAKEPKTPTTTDTAYNTQHLQHTSPGDNVQIQIQNNNGNNIRNNEEDPNVCAYWFLGFIAAIIFGFLAFLFLLCTDYIYGRRKKFFIYGACTGLVLEIAAVILFYFFVVSVFIASSSWYTQCYKSWKQRVIRCAFIVIIRGSMRNKTLCTSSAIL